MHYHNGLEWVKKNIYIQPFYSREPRTRLFGCFFKTLFFDSYFTKNEEFFKNQYIYNDMRLDFLIKYCLAYHGFGRRPSQFFLQIKPSFIPVIAEKFDVIIKSLRGNRVDIVFNLNAKEFEKINFRERAVLYKHLYDLHDNGHRFCLAEFDWRFNSIDDYNIIADIFDYVMTTPLPSNNHEVNEFIDICFRIKEGYDIELVLMGIQGKTELDIACRVPYYALTGDYIYPTLNVNYINRFNANGFI